MGAVVGLVFFFVAVVVFVPLYGFVDWCFSKNGRGKITFKEYMRRF